MILRSSPPSPFGRKVKIVAKLTGTYDRIRVDVTDTNDPDDSIRAQNPLGKIPTLILDNGHVLYDSRVICEYLDSLHDGSKLFPAMGEERWDALRMASLADGMLDAAILLVYEKRFRPEDMRHQPWMDYQRAKLDRSLAALHDAPPALPKNPHIGHVGIACALGYLDFRFDGTWRQANPELVDWLDAFSGAVPAFGETAPTG